MCTTKNVFIKFDKLSKYCKKNKKIKNKKERARNNLCSLAR